jgi:predicted nucleic acid-binding protein
LAEPGTRSDGRVAVKWVVSETDSGRAGILLDHGPLAPDLIYTECANVLWKKVRRREMTQEEAGTAGQTLEQADLTILLARGRPSP